MPSASSSTCQVCQQAQAKYTCPKCRSKTCSLSCDKEHKSDCHGQPSTSSDRSAKDQVQGTSVREDANVVQSYIPMSRYDENHLIKDYVFLNSISRSAQQVGRHIQSLNLLPPPPSSSNPHPSRGSRDPNSNNNGPPSERMTNSQRQREAFRKQIGYRRLGIMLLPDGMVRRKLNASGWNPKEKRMQYTAELVFPCSQEAISVQDEQGSQASVERPPLVQDLTTLSKTDPSKESRSVLIHRQRPDTSIQKLVLDEMERRSFGKKELKLLSDELKRVSVSSSSMKGSDSSITEEEKREEREKEGKGGANDGRRAYLISPEVRQSLGLPCSDSIQKVTAKSNHASEATTRELVAEVHRSLGEGVKVAMPIFEMKLRNESSVKFLDWWNRKAEYERKVSEEEERDRSRMIKASGTNWLTGIEEPPIGPRGGRVDPPSNDETIVRDKGKGPASGWENPGLAPQASNQHQRHHHQQQQQRRRRQQLGQEEGVVHPPKTHGYDQARHFNGRSSSSSGQALGATSAETPQGSKNLKEEQLIPNPPTWYTGKNPLIPAYLLTNLGKTLAKNQPPPPPPPSTQPSNVIESTKSSSSSSKLEEKNQESVRPGLKDFVPDRPPIKVVDAMKDERVQGSKTKSKRGESVENTSKTKSKRNLLILPMEATVEESISPTVLPEGWGVVEYPCFEVWEASALDQANQEGSVRILSLGGGEEEQVSKRKFEEEEEGEAGPDGGKRLRSDPEGEPKEIDGVGREVLGSKPTLTLVSYDSSSDSELDE
ncbi:hypothetical protein IE53DRAFT_390037 [Violaceomyces palustris]|uniref:Uncharacterized protein n=1 Tax=Violaceomyces palustris TaxID=1673888 RepID=A0ACD0NPS1_9BASI|nr:hypothetical protein IE53DRAFT_390037 [Violaceomyces palustris]